MLPRDSRLCETSHSSSVVKLPCTCTGPWACMCRSRGLGLGQVFGPCRFTWEWIRRSTERSVVIHHASVQTFLAQSAQFRQHPTTELPRSCRVPRSTSADFLQIWTFTSTPCKFLGHMQVFTLQLLGFVYMFPRQMLVQLQLRMYLPSLAN